MRKKDPTRCGKCGGRTQPFTMFANASTGESYALCMNCMSNRTSQSITDLAELDSQIEDIEETLAYMEPKLRQMGDLKFPPGLEAFAFTPMKSFEMAQMTLASLKSRRLELLTKGENEERLQYELDKKIEEENYEEANELQKRLDDLKATPMDKRKPPLEEQRTGSLFDSDEEAEGKCINCNKRFPKPLGLFQDFDIGDCHQMCLICCITEIPQHVKTIKKADSMIEEMEDFADNMDMMIFMGKIMREDLEGMESMDIEEIDMEVEINKMKLKGDSPGHMMVKALKMRKDFLEKNGEDEDLIKAADEASELLKNTFGENSVTDLSNLLNGLLKDEEEKFAQEQAGEKSKSKPALKPKKFTATEIVEKSKSWFGEQEDTLEKCKNCQKYPVKNPDVFSDYDLGECEQLCWICGMQEIGLYPKDEQTVVNMLEEIKRISQVLDEFIVVGELQEKGEFSFEKLEEIDVEKMDVEVKSRQQYFARKMVEMLEQRKIFLKSIGEKGEMVSLADKVVRMMRGQIDAKDSALDKMGKIFDTLEAAMDEEE